ncbi:MAG: DUF115 domain-containing protein, partial [Planctomycetales bacterium]|nr:DUF115 domain-containing protein [Planctomycetales bacterium]
QHFHAWGERKLTGSGRANDAYLRRFKDIHRGQRCVIIGNGPSLKRTEMSLLKNEFTFGLNRIYLMFDDLGFATTYHVATNKYVVEQCGDDLRELDSPLFTFTKNRRFLDGFHDVGYLHRIMGTWFSRDLSRGVCGGYTVTYVAMQLAYYMGFTDVVLVGVDHRFAATGEPNQLVESVGPDTSHFDPTYFGKGMKWQLPDLENSEISYGLARRAFEEDGRRIVDSTVDGALEVFPKIRLADALK